MRIFPLLAKMPEEVQRHFRKHSIPECENADDSFKNRIYGSMSVMGTRLAFTHSEHPVASDDHLNAFESIIPCDGGMLIPPSIFHAMEAKNIIRKCPRTLFSDNNIEAMKNGVNPDNVIYLAQDTGVDFETEMRGRVYFAHCKGLVISCCIQSVLTKNAKRIWQEGSGEILGRYQKFHNPPKWRYIVRQFYALKCIRDRDNYRMVKLCDEMANNHYKRMSVGIIVRATFIENRPSIEHQLDHGRQDKDDDSLENTSWVTPSVNCDKDHIDRSMPTSDLYTIWYLPYGNDRVLQDGRWYEHPTMEGILFHHSGNYVFNEKSGKFLGIMVKTYKKSGWQRVTVQVRGKTRFMNRVALEAFEGIPLQEKEQSDHMNRIRTDNSKGNLRRCSSLFNNRYKRPTRVSPITGVQGVTYNDLDEGYFIARVQMMTPDERTSSKTKTKWFSVKTHGYNEALQLAKNWRQRFG